MAWNDTPTGYGRLSIALHWLGAALVIGLFWLGNRLEDIPRGPEFGAARNLHISVGVVAFVFLAARVLWRLTSRGGPAKPAAPGAMERVAQVVQWGLLAAITILIVTGPLSVWAGGRPLDVFGLMSLPSPLPKLEWLHEGTEVVHAITSKVIFALVALHVLGALKHLVVDRDGVFQRMLAPAARR